jgi:hypothetical protein
MPCPEGKGGRETHTAKEIQLQLGTMGLVNGLARWTVSRQIL